MVNRYEEAARDAGLVDRFGDGWQAVCARHDIAVPKLTERRKADRETMVKLIQLWAFRNGWNWHRCEYARPHEVRIEVWHSSGLACSIEFERFSAMPDHYCVPWHFRADGEGYKRLSDSFAKMQSLHSGTNCSVNPYHRRKCTAFAPGIDALLDNLQLAADMAKDGTAFESEARHG